MTHAELMGERRSDVPTSECSGLMGYVERYATCGRTRDVWRCDRCGDVLFTDGRLCVVAVRAHERQEVAK